MVFFKKIKIVKVAWLFEERCQSNGDAVVMSAVVRVVVFFSLFFVNISWADVRVICDYPATPLSRYTVNLVQNKLVRLAGLDYGGSLLVRLQIDQTLSERLGQEGYRIDVTTAGATIVAAAESGTLYGALSFLEWLIAETTVGIRDQLHADIDFPSQPGQAADFLRHLPDHHIESRPFYPLRFFHLSNLALGVADLIDSEMVPEKYNLYSGIEGAFSETVVTWKRWCDWCSRHRINRLSNWPYSAGTNWWDLALDPATRGMSPFPDSEIVRAAKVREELFRYAASRGVKPFLMNYLTGSATSAIARNHPELVGVLDDDVHHHGAMSFCHASNRLKNVFVAQIKAILRTYPSLAGIHIRWWGESFPCQCDHCRGRQGELQRRLTLQVIEAALQERPDIEILLSGRLFLHGSADFWKRLPKNVMLQTKWGKDWEPTADPGLDTDDIVATAHPFLISQNLPCEEVSPFGCVQYTPLAKGIAAYAAQADQVPNLQGFSIVTAEKDFGWITETNYLAAAKLNWAGQKIDVAELITGYLKLTYGDAGEPVYQALDRTQKVWEEFSVDFCGIALYKDYYRMAWMFGLDSLMNADLLKLEQSSGRIEKYARMLSEAVFLLERSRRDVRPLALLRFDDLIQQTCIFAEFFTSRRLLVKAFLHRWNGDRARMRRTLRLACQADQRLVDLALSKPNLADDFEMEGMTEPVNYVRDTPFMRQGAWDFLHNRVFKEMDAIQALCGE